MPRLSKSNTPPPADTPAQEAEAPKSESPRTAPCPFCGHPLRIGARFCDSCGAQLVRKPGRGSAIPEAFIGIAIAVILLIIYPHFIEYLLHPHDTSAFDAIDANGAVLPYTKSAFFWSDIGITFFCLVLLVDAAIILMARSRTLLLGAAVLSALAAVLNLWVIAHTWGLAGFPLQCAVAIAIALYTAMLQFQAAREV
ncbi:MAG TPA: zinc ribbon domain-containing protein [Humisphaera sp.]|nr:zinc ribbon domain-containing protein [Humisphaera sp.]